MPFSEREILLLSGYVDDALTDAERDEFTRLLAQSPELQRELASWQAMLGAVRALPTLAAPRNFTLTPAMVRPRPRITPIWRTLSAAAAMVVVVLGAMLLRLDSTTTNARQQAQVVAIASTATPITPAQDAANAQSGTMPLATQAIARESEMAMTQAIQLAIAPTAIPTIARLEMTSAIVTDIAPPVGFQTFESATQGMGGGADGNASDPQAYGVQPFSSSMGEELETLQTFGTEANEELLDDMTMLTERNMPASPEAFTFAPMTASVDSPDGNASPEEFVPAPMIASVGSADAKMIEPTLAGILARLWETVLQALARFLVGG